MLVSRMFLRYFDVLFFVPTVVYFVFICVEVYATLRLIAVMRLIPRFHC